MDRLEAMAIFVATVETGSLAAAGRRLGHSPATVTRAVAQLEAAAGERLLNRSTRRFAVTEAGERHAATYRHILTALAQLGPSPPDARLSGSVTVTAPELFGRLHVLPLVETFLAAHPGVQVRLLLLNRMVDLVGEGVDVAVRLAELPDSGLTALRLGSVRRMTCAAPSYLARHAPPQSPADLSAHACIGLNEAGAQELWRYRETAGGGRQRAVRVSCRLALNSAAAGIAAAARGLGIVRALSYQVEQQVAAGQLVALLADYEPDPVPVHLLFQPRPPGASAIRAFIDHAAPLLRRALGDDQPR